MEKVLQRRATDKPPQDFPDDILIDIFLRLPVRSLFLLKSVSTHWLGIIRSPVFIDLYNNRPNPSNNPILLLHASYDKSHLKTRDRFCFQHLALTMLSDDETATLPYKDEVALETLSPSIYSKPLWFHKGRLLGPCNGLFCITDLVDVAILNPATKRCREVPPTPVNSCAYDGRYCNLYGYYNRVCFGFDSASSDYKVVGFRSATQQLNDGCHYYWVEIFSLSTNSWTRVKSVVPANDVHQLRNCDLFFNNAVHWFGCDFNNICSIVVFDLNKEAFKLLQLPSDNNFTVNDWAYLSVLDESFTVILDRGSSKFQIWVMKEYGDYNSWTELFNISVGMRIRKPLSLGEDGEFLLENSLGQLVSFNLKTREMKKLEVHEVNYAFRYRERLISLKRSVKEEFGIKQKMEAIWKFIGYKL